VGVPTSSWDADDDDEEWFELAGTLDGFDPDAAEDVGGAFGADGLVENKPDTHFRRTRSPEARAPDPKTLQTTSQAQCTLGVRMAGIGLAAAIEELRQELYRAQDLGADQQFAFGIEDAELELHLELHNSGKGDGKVSFGVATVGAGGEHSTVRTHRLTLKLSVRDRARGGSSPEISDTEAGSWDEE
jgi:hypothetical protein